MNKLFYTKMAVNDLSEVQNFLSSTSAKYGQQIIKELKYAISLLKTYPEMGWQIFTSQQEHLRQVLFHSYRIVYYYQEERVVIITIQYQTRPPENIPQLKDLKI